MPDPTPPTDGTAPRTLTQDERLDLIDRLPDDMTIWDDDEELPHFADRDLTWWMKTLGHASIHSGGCCEQCGCAITCLAGAFHEALLATVIRELNRLGALRKPEEPDHV